MKTFTLLVGGAVLAGVVSAATSCRTTPSIASAAGTLDPPALTTEAEQRGQIVFMRHCYSCHPDGSGGLGPSLFANPLPAETVRLQVRTGLGGMPAFGEQQLPDDDLEDMIEYLEVLRAHHRRQG